MFENELKNFFQDKAEVVAAYVFGSCAGGKQRSESDADIAILFDSRDRTAVQRLLDEYLAAISRLLRKDVHLVAMNFAGEALLEQVFKKGQCILVNDRKAFSRFKMIAFSKFADFGYYRKLFQNGIIRKVMQG